MKVRVLGSAAGGGVPQWNCGCSNCTEARNGTGVVRPRTQSSVAVSADGERWLLLNASPDLRAQLAAFPDLQPRTLRSSALAAVLLTDAEVDHTAGLLLLREGGELSLHATPFVRGALEKSGLARVLGAYLELRWTEIQPGAAFRPASAGGDDLGLEVEAIEVAGDAPLYLSNGHPREQAGAAPYWEGEGAGTRSTAGVVIGVRIREPRADAALVYVPGVAAVNDGLRHRIGPRDVLLWDGTFWEDDELVRLGISGRRARDMGHLPLSGPDGALAALADVGAARKALIHVNNTNPILRRGSNERLAVEAAGWEVTCDGSEFRV
jgi:pyrroloquinoline quinone biosynthesis protein B